MENREFYIKCDGINLHAKLDFPREDKEKYPCVIVVHGLTGHMEETHIKAVANACNEMGYAALRVDMYGHGKSEGEFKNHTVTHWVLELMQIIDYVNSLEFVTDVYLTGHSQGGLTVILTAAVKKDAIKAIMPLSPALMAKDVALHGGFPNTEYDPDNMGENIMLFGEHEISTNYMRTCRFLPIDEAIHDFDKKVLLVHADTDELVPYRYAVEAQKKYKDARLVTIPDDDHCYLKHLSMVTDAVKEFLQDMNK